MKKACNQEDWEEDLHAVCSFHKGDFNQDLLRTQLATFGVHFKQMNEDISGLNIFDVKQYFQSLSPAQSSLLAPVKRLLQLILVSLFTLNTGQAFSQSFNVLTP